MVTARPLGWMSVDSSTSRAGWKWLARIGSPALSGARTRWPTGLSTFGAPSSSAWMNEAVTKAAGISRTAIISEVSSAPSLTSTLAQSTCTVRHRSRAARSRARIAAHAAPPASSPSTTAIRTGFLPESTRPPSGGRDATQAPTAGATVSCPMPGAMLLIQRQTST